MRQGGELTVIDGPMFANKTNTLIRLELEAQRCNQIIVTIKPKIDNRYEGHESQIISHSGGTVSYTHLTLPTTPYV